MGPRACVTPEGSAQSRYDAYQLSESIDDERCNSCSLRGVGKQSLDEYSQPTIRNVFDLYKEVCMSGPQCHPGAHAENIKKSECIWFQKRDESAIKISKKKALDNITHKSLASGESNAAEVAKCILTD
eukprot:424310-Amphidinium_carterae.1